MYRKKAKPERMKQNKQDRLDEAEGRKKGRTKNTQTVADRLDEAEGLKRGKRKMEAKKKMESVKTSTGTIKFKKGGLHESLKVGMDYKFKKEQLEGYSQRGVGATIRIKGNSIKITPKIKKQIDLGITLMSMDKKKKK